VSISHRNRRVLVCAQTDEGSEGSIDETYRPVASAASDGAWWAARGVPSGREITLGAQAEHQADAVFGFDAHAPVDADSLLIDGAEYFKVTAVLPRRNGCNETQVLAAFADRATYHVELG